MPQHWILKTEPSDYSFADLQRDRRTRWSGVSNPVALKHLRSMAPGDEVMIYHTGGEKRIVGLARVAGAPYGEPIAKPVTLAAIKADAAFAELALVRQGRLSVVPVPAPLWKRLLELGRRGDGTTGGRG